MNEERDDVPRACDVVAAHERWAYGQGWIAGLDEGKRLGFDEGYGAGFDAGADIGAARSLLALKAALKGRLPDLLDKLPRFEDLLFSQDRSV